MSDANTDKKPSHIFISGYKQCGKTTVVNKVLEKINTPYKGLISYSVIQPGGRRVYIKSAKRDSESYLCGECRGGTALKNYPEVFNEKGVSWIEADGSVKLIVIDEVGFLEESAFAYENALLNLLERTDVHVLGVIRDGSGVLTEQIRRHPNVSVVNVTENNRDSIVPEILNLILGS